MTLSCYVKRGLDIVGSAMLILLLLPIFFLVAISIWVLEGRPIFYASRRMVAKDKEVTIIKFRTMVPDATAPKYRLEERFMRDGYLDIPLACEVYTPIGRWLERFQVVELLQLFNVLAGQMSFIGNRPLPRRNLELLNNIGSWEGRFDSPSGISGISQVVGKYGLSPGERLELEALYSKVYREGNVLWCDLMIVRYTLRLLVIGKPVTLHKGRELLIQCSGYPQMSEQERGAEETHCD